MTRDKLQVGAEQSPKCWEIMGNEAAQGSVLVTLLHLDQVFLVRGPSQTVLFLVSMLLPLHHLGFFSLLYLFWFCYYKWSPVPLHARQSAVPLRYTQPLVWRVNEWRHVCSRWVSVAGVLSVHACLCFIRVLCKQLTNDSTLLYTVSVKLQF